MNLLRIWAKALGSKEGNTDKEANMVAIVRTIIVLFHVVVGITVEPGK